jgi:hypothetical protein
MSVPVHGNKRFKNKNKNNIQRAGLFIKSTRDEQHSTVTEAKKKRGGLHKRFGYIMTIFSTTALVPHIFLDNTFNTTACQAFGVHDRRIGEAVAADARLKAGHEIRLLAESEPALQAHNSRRQLPCCTQRPSRALGLFQARLPVRDVRRA